MIDPSIPRLYAYHRALREAHREGKSTITSEALAAMLGHTVTSTQIRKDLSALGALGRRGFGYAIDPLVEQLAFVLGLEQDWSVAIAGFGYLGHALASFITSRESRFKIAAIFDVAPALIGTTWQGIVVSDTSNMESIVQDAGCNIGVIAVPAASAQATAARVASAGVRAILNFAPTTLHLRAPVIVRNIDLAGEMSILTHWLTAAERSEEAQA